MSGWHPLPSMYGIMMSPNRLSLYNGEAEVRERR